MIPNARIWHPDGWKDGIRFDVGTHGDIARESHGGTTQQRVLPGIANLHSHAFQRAMAGMAERQTDPRDSFWTWRDTMYRFAARFTPESLYAVAAQLYAEMLAAGYTTVCEFHTCTTHRMVGRTPTRRRCPRRWCRPRTIPVSA